MSASESKVCQNCHKDFTIEPEDFSFYEKMQVPLPTQCPECRLKQRLLFRNENSLHWRTCDLCNKKILSVYGEDAPFPVYCQSCWHSDKWDAKDYGTPYDPARPFFEQLLELQHRVPHEAIQGYNNENSDYANAINSKNAYLSSIVIESDTVLYSRFIQQCTDCVSCLYATKCSECIRITRSAFCSQCADGDVLDSCRNTYFTSHSTGCSYCYGCINLRHKEYHIFNKPYTKEEYEKRVAALLALPYEEQQQKVREFYRTQMHRGVIHENSANVTGQEIYFSKNCRHCNVMNFVSDSAYCFEVTSFSRNNETVYDLYDCTIVGDISRGYQMIGGGRSSRIRFGVITDDSMELEYCMYCYGCENLLGCIGMRKGKYCILNKPYEKEEFLKLRSEIVKSMTEAGEYGKFFPPSFSPFKVNETLMWEFFPMDRATAKREGREWLAAPSRNYEISIPSGKLPSVLSDSIVEEIIECEHKGSCNENCTTAFRIHPRELQLLKKLKLPLPRLCPNCRFLEQLRGLRLFETSTRSCMCNQLTTSYQNTAKHFHGDQPCPNEFETSYAPEREEIVYCEECYQSEVV